MHIHTHIHTHTYHWIQIECVVFSIRQCYRRTTVALYSPSSFLSLIYFSDSNCFFFFLHFLARVISAFVSTMFFLRFRMMVLLAVDKDKHNKYIRGFMHKGVIRPNVCFILSCRFATPQATREPEDPLLRDSLHREFLDYNTMRMQQRRNIDCWETRKSHRLHCFRLFMHVFFLFFLSYSSRFGQLLNWWERIQTRFSGYLYVLLRVLHR